MNIFEQLDEIITTKDNKLLDNDEDLDTFIPYLTQRWLSMYSPSFAQIVNVSSNQLWKAMETKRDWYKLFVSIIPKSAKRRIPYIKKAEKTAKKKIDGELIALIADNLEISRREVKLYIEQGVLNVKQYEKDFNL